MNLFIKLFLAAVSLEATNQAGVPALRQLGERDKLPDLKAAYISKDPRLIQALDNSSKYFANPSNSISYAPFTLYTTWEKAGKGITVFKQLLSESPDEISFENSIKDQFTIWQSVGSDGHGTVTFTGYIAPSIHVSATRTQDFNVPIYKVPSDVVIEDSQMIGRTEKKGLTAVPSRQEVYEGDYLKGNEIAWVNPYGLFLIEMNGSAKLKFPDGKEVCISYSTRTPGQIEGLRILLVRKGFLTPTSNWHEIKTFATERPDVIQTLLLENNGFILYSMLPCDKWPLGSLNVPLTEQTSIATDQKLFPPGSLTFVSTTVADVNDQRIPFQKFLLNQDAGSGIRGPGHVDIYMGSKHIDKFEALRETSTGSIYFFFLK